ncbi:response regulator [Spirosoma sp. SC4-14]|uniref:response regulator n=1 Tax=Spirosoma sp. SC4-14 TaxID=3128900 RepID=UPI0030D53690
MSQDQSFEILLVDDDPAVADLLTRIGQQHFAEATFSWVTSPQESIDFLNQRSTKLPRLILLDIDFHLEVDGLNFLPDLSNRIKGLIPIIMLTVSNTEDNVQKAYAAGAAAFTLKPDGLQGWKDYLKALKAYWYELITLPPPSLSQN